MAAPPRDNRHLPHFHRDAPVKAPVLVATTANITLSGEQTIDGVLTSSSRVLVKNHATATSRGIYVSASGAWARAYDMEAGELTSGTSVRVRAGTANAGKVFYVANTTNPTIGTDAVTFTEQSGGVTAHSALTGLTTGDDHPQYSQTTLGGDDVVHAHGSMGAAETIDATLGNYHTGTLDANCAITVQGFVSSRGGTILVGLTQDGTGGWDVTWDSDVEFSGNDQPDQAIGALTWFVLWTVTGDATIYGAKVGGGGDPATTVESETTLGISPAVGTDTEYARQDHTHGSPSASTIASAVATAGFVGALLIADVHSTPLVFDDILQNDDGDDLLYADV